MHKETYYQSGFSLIELAVVLTVIGLVAGSLLSITVSNLEAQRLKITKERMDFIMETLEDYIVSADDEDPNTWLLPCPADPRDLNTEELFGIEETGILPPPDFCESSAPNMRISGFTSSKLVGGMVPVRTLQIAPYYAFDGYGRRFTYVVDSDLTRAGAGGYADQTGDIIIRNSTDAMGKEVTNEGAVLLMSHGKNGHGAWRGKGVTRLTKGTVSDDEQENSYNGDGVTGQTVGTSFDDTFIQAPESASFDDIVVYKTRWQLP